MSVHEKPVILKFSGVEGPWIPVNRLEALRSFGGGSRDRFQILFDSDHVQPPEPIILQGSEGPLVTHVTMSKGSVKAVRVDGDGMVSIYARERVLS